MEQHILNKWSADSVTVHQVSICQERRCRQITHALRSQSRMRVAAQAEHCESSFNPQTSASTANSAVVGGAPEPLRTSYAFRFASETCQGDDPGYRVSLCNLSPAQGKSSRLSPWSLLPLSTILRTLSVKLHATEIFCHIQRMYSCIYS